MPKKKSKESQSERFRKAVQDMIADGELNPTEADEAPDRLVRDAGHTSSSAG